MPMLCALKCRTAIRGLAGLFIGYLSAYPALAAIDLEYRTSTDPWLVGETVEVGLYAVSDDPEIVQTFSAIRMVFAWDPIYLDLFGLDQTGAVPLLSSYFPLHDMWGLNEVVPPQDGDGLYQALANFGEPVETTIEGVLVTTFLFEALEVTSGTLVDILVEGGDPPIDTAVIDGVVPGLNVTGTLSGTIVTIVPEPACLVMLALGSLVMPRRRREQGRFGRDRRVPYTTMRRRAGVGLCCPNRDEL